ncbi:DUF1365 domain-containing protein [Mycobacterium heckeshornense]|uniref:Uncharacterized protein n=1 Tax=Mycobacterium heckeshornense TaxID=110505 RepID=A0A2G8BJH5_9MYCO|nr:DUF1365 family protein [Mycobacterium heckeshornense]KMV24426.1 hypothetical protein ACT16_00660 [Mycobacterium heckeshornense]MCV7035491.1 DUF1365 family protein [Mycobacterium heckeshornense]PIJ37943.1 DUF1365 domain-containing protein [Mycobacterium heckeshornense]BCO37913.1 hypothetical protein MHEC_43460 [Mycobacterium heckeshornense]BCQ10778.1 hypothetical protein JMUB5695_04237 [Mycobacterium heckeshornense]
MLTPAIYRTTITHSRQAPVRHCFRYRSYSWYVDIDDLPRLPWWLSPFARFEPRDHLVGQSGDSLRDRVYAFLADHDITPPAGPVTALLQARVLGYVFNPLSLFWCHDRGGTVRRVIAEVHNTYGDRHAYLLPPAESPVPVAKTFYVSPFNPVDGYYTVRAPRPGSHLRIMVSYHRDNQPAFVATLSGKQLPATVWQVLRMQIVAPLAPMVVTLRIRVQGIKLWLRRVRVVPR